MPWRDPTGRFSPFKLAVFILLFVPASLIAFRYANGGLGPLAINEAVHQSGNWTLRLILISLAVTPARQLLRWPRVMQARRMVGVAAFIYAAIHLTLYAADQAFDLQKVATEILVRIYLTIGFAALLILAALAATSTNGMARRLGAARWRRLHRLVYAAALLGVVHFFMQTKFNVDEPWVMAGLFAWLMAFRALAWAGGGRWTAWRLAMLAVMAALGTAVSESIYYWIKVGAPPARVLSANFMFNLPNIRPVWIVLSICMAAALLGVVRHPAAGSLWARLGVAARPPVPVRIPARKPPARLAKHRRREELR
jgi:sulfoxide reductase heme-binding subunit YedZ